MKIVLSLNFVLIVVGLLSSIVFIRHYTAGDLAFSCVPYAALVALAIFSTGKKRNDSSKIAALATTIIISAICGSSYYEVSYATDHHSTEGLVFLIVPFYMTIMLPAIFLFAKLLVQLTTRFRATRFNTQ